MKTTGHRLIKTVAGKLKILIALLVAAAGLLASGCSGGGSGDDPSTPAAVQSTGGMQVEAQLQPQVQQWSSAQANNILNRGQDGRTLELNSIVSLSPGVVFIANSEAFKVLSSTVSNGHTFITVTTPSLAELFVSLKINGQVDTSSAVFEPESLGEGVTIETNSSTSMKAAANRIDHSSIANLPDVKVKIHRTIDGATFDIGLSVKSIATVNVDYTAARGFKAGTLTVDGTISADGTVSVVAFKKNGTIPVGRLCVSVPISLGAIQVCNPIDLKYSLEADLESTLPVSFAKAFHAVGSIDNGWHTSGSVDWTPIETKLGPGGAIGIKKCVELSGKLDIGPASGVDLVLLTRIVPMRVVLETGLRGQVKFKFVDALYIRRTLSIFLRAKLQADLSLGFTAAPPYLDAFFDDPPEFDPQLEWKIADKAEPFADDPALPVCIPDATINAKVGKPSPSGVPVTFSATVTGLPTGGQPTYLWTFDDGTTSSGPQPVHNYVSLGTYPVHLTITDSSGAATTVEKDIVINAAGNYSGTFTGDDGGNWSVAISDTGDISGSGNSAQAGAFVVSGTLTEDGTFAATAGAATTGARYQGSVKPGNGQWLVSGTWVNAQAQEGGSFAGGSE